MITIAGHYEIDPSVELSAYDQPQCPAFSASDVRQPDRSYFALVTPAHLAPRHDLMRYLTRLGVLPMIRPLALGIAEWPHTQDERLIIVYEQPGGPRLATPQDPTFKPFREDELQVMVVDPVLAVLKEFNSRGYTHRAIRIDNLYYTSADKSAFVLGECVAMPPATNQPILYETIEASMAQPAGRGPGWMSDDLYSLGVVLAMLLSGGRLCEGMSDQEILQSKIANGSYGALVGRSRVSMPYMELLRGLLCDITEERWTLKDLMAWAQGRRQTPKQPMLPKRANRPFDVGKQAFWTSKALSAAAGADWEVALGLCQDQGLTAWFNRGLEDGQKAERIQNLFRSGVPSSNGGPSHRLASEILMVVDEEAPLRYRGLGLYPDAAAQLLGFEWDQQDRRQVIAEMIRSRVPNAWFDAQKGGGAEHTLLRKNFATMLQQIAQPRLGYGLERALYDFNPHWPCRSPLLRGAYVHSLLAVLPALERAATLNPEETREPIDHHLVGFIASRSSQLPERILAALARNESPTSFRLAILHLFAELQRETTARPCPAFANWLARLTGPIVESYHSGEARRVAARAIKTAADSGDLRQLALAADNPDLRERDETGLEAARREYHAIEEEIAWLESGGMVSDAFVEVRAQRLAAVACGCISSAVFLLMTIYYVA